MSYQTQGLGYDVMTQVVYHASDELNVYQAARSGNLQWLKNRQSSLDPVFPVLPDEEHIAQFLFEISARNGHLEVAKWIVNEFAAARHQQRVLNITIPEGFEVGKNIDVTSKDNYILRGAAENGHLDIIKWLVKEYPAVRQQQYDLDIITAKQLEESDQYVDVTALNNFAIRLAANNNHLDIIKWLVKDYSEWLKIKKLEDPSFVGKHVDVTIMNNDSLRRAARNGHLDIIKWLVKEYPAVRQQQYDLDIITAKQLEHGHIVDVTADDNSALLWAAENDFLNVAKWLVNESWKFEQPIFSAESAERAMTLLKTTLDAECPEYTRLQLLLNLGYSAKEAISCTRKVLLHTPGTSTVSRRL